jgi:hypothetical protein
MSVLNKLACMQGRKDEVPNQTLARELVESQDQEGIHEIAENLFNKELNIQSDCIKVLYEVGYLKPELISGYAVEILKLLKSKNNRLVWGAMITLATIAQSQADLIYENIELIFKSMEAGSVITVDNGVKVLAVVASRNKAYHQRIFPYLIHHLENCRPKEVGQHAESIMAAVVDQAPAIQNEFIQVLKKREISMTSAQQARIRKLYKALEKARD